MFIDQTGSRLTQTFARLLAGASRTRAGVDTSSTGSIERGGAGCDASIHPMPTASVSEILIRDGDSFEGALKRFSRKVQQEGILSEARRRQRYEPPSVKRKRKAEARARKMRKALARAAARGY